MKNTLTKEQWERLVQKEIYNIRESLKGVLFLAGEEDVTKESFKLFVTHLAEYNRNLKLLLTTELKKVK